MGLPGGMIEVHDQHIAAFWRVINCLKIETTPHQAQTLSTAIESLVSRAYEDGAADQCLLELAGRGAFIADLRAGGTLPGGDDE